MRHRCVMHEGLLPPCLQSPMFTLPFAMSLEKHPSLSDTHVRVTWCVVLSRLIPYKHYCMCTLHVLATIDTCYTTPALHLT
jgi:hypothetical protein